MADYLALAEAALAEPDPCAGLVAFPERSQAMQADDPGCAPATRCPASRSQTRCFEHPLIPAVTAA